MKPSEKAVRDANRRVFEAKDFDGYDANPSIFERSRQQEIEAVLAAAPAKGALLDVGCGTGNILRLAQRHFERCAGVDLSVKFMSELRRREGLGLAAGEAAHLPFAGNTFDMVTMYAMVHHLLEPGPAFREAWRVLRPGGCLFLDHDPNWYFGRIYHLYYRLRWSQSPGFGSWDAELSEWHHTRSGGLNPDLLKSKLERTGFRDVRVSYRITSNPDLPLGFRLVRSALRALARIHPFKSLHTHFRVLAFK